MGEEAQLIGSHLEKSVRRLRLQLCCVTVTFGVLLLFLLAVVIVLGSTQWYYFATADVSTSSTSRSYYASYIQNIRHEYANSTASNDTCTVTQVSCDYYTIPIFAAYDLGCNTTNQVYSARITDEYSTDKFYGCTYIHTTPDPDTPILFDCGCLNAPTNSLSVSYITSVYFGYY
jgi:hypothetical protein